MAELIPKLSTNGIYVTIKSKRGEEKQISRQLKTLAKSPASHKIHLDWSLLFDNHLGRTPILIRQCCGVMRLRETKLMLLQLTPNI
jgi:hypothetical protein